MQVSTGHIDAALTNVSLRYKPFGLIADQVMPRVKVKKQTDIIRNYDMSHLRNERTDIGVGGRTPAPVFEWNLAANKTYICRGYAVKSLVTQQDVDNYDKPISAEIDTTEALTDIMSIDRELRVATAYQDTSVLTRTVTLSGTSKWSDHTNGVSDPVGDIKTAIESVRTYGGRTPNIMVLDWKTAVEFATHPDVIDLTKYSGEVTKQRMLALIRNLFNIEPIIAEGMYNSAKEGQTDSLSPIWGTDVTIAYVDPKPGLKTYTGAVSFDWKPGRFTKKWVNEDPDGTYVRVKENGLDEKILISDLFYVIKSAI